jgi:1-acyl-sn-glycerol-3-phosphate acyltransferase
MDPEFITLSESLVNELVGAVGLPKRPFWHALAWRLFRKITDRLAMLGLTFDRLVGSEGLPAGSAWALTRFCTPILVDGQENVPSTGPLLVISNHPGAYDGLVIFSKLVRKDICWVATEIPFFKHLPNTRSHMLFASRVDVSNRMLVMRTAIRHLRSGGTLVYFGAGHRDPDPAVYPHAGKMMLNWLEGISFIREHVPGLTLLPCVVSGVVSQKWARHPVTLLRSQQIDKQRLSEFGQVITQLLSPGKFLVSPKISFGAPILTPNSLPEIIAHEQELLVAHCQKYGGEPGL